MSLEIKNLSVHAGAFRLSDINMKVESGETAVLMGRSGVGKTTLVEAICGLRKVSEGEVFINGRRISKLQPAEREICYVPQDSALFSHMTVRDHLQFSLVLRKWSITEIKQRLEYLSDLMKLEDLLTRKPLNLSGGEKKRVAIGRAIAAKPSLLCLDEAFTGIDEEGSDEIILLLKQMINEEQLTTFNITHRQHEVEQLGGKQYCLSEGGLILKE